MARVTFTGEGRMQEVAARMVSRGCWFAVTPMPDDKWDLEFKNEDGNAEYAVSAVPPPEPQECENCHGQEPMDFRNAEVNGVQVDAWICDECGHAHLPEARDPGR